MTFDQKKDCQNAKTLSAMQFIYRLGYWLHENTLKMSQNVSSSRLSYAI